MKRLDAGMLLAVGIAVAALALRLFFRRMDALWLDEANSVLIAVRSPSEILAALRVDGNPPLYYLFLHLWARVFGDGESAVKALSIASGALLPPGLYLSGRRLFGGTAGVVAAVLALIWPLHVYYSQQVRMYALVPLAALAFLVALADALGHATGRGSGPAGLRAGERSSVCHEFEPCGDRRPLFRWGIVVAGGLALIWLHHYGMFFVAAAPVAWLAAGPRTSVHAKRLFASLAVIFAINLPWLLIVLRQAGSDVGAWIAWSFRPEAPLHSLLLFGAGWPVPPSVQGLAGLGTSPWFAAAWFIIAGVGGAALAIGAREPVSQQGSKQARHESGLDVSRRRRALGVLAFLLIPIVLPWLVSLIARPIYYVGRYEIVAYPAFALLVGAGADALGRLRPRAVFFVALLLCVYAALAVRTLAQYRAAPPDRTTAQIAERLAGWVSSNDRLIATGLGRAPIEYYLAQLRPELAPIESFPNSAGAHLGWFDLDSAQRNTAALDREARSVAERFRGFEGTVFLIDNAHFPELRAVNEPLRRHLKSASSRSQVLVRAGPNPEAEPLFEVTAFRFRD